MDSKYKLLYVLENETCIVSEIKRVDISTDDKSKMYLWIAFNKSTNRLTHLQFRSMSGDESKQERIFDDSKITFDTQKGIFCTPTNTEELHVKNVANYITSHLLDTAILTLLEERAE